MQAALEQMDELLARCRKLTSVLASLPCENASFNGGNRCRRCDTCSAREEAGLGD